MKQSFALIAIIFSLFTFGCKKNNSTTGQEDSEEILVLEYKTNEPIQGVQVKLVTCARYDIEFGCQSNSVIASKTTNASGIVSFTTHEINKASQGITFHKSGYWDKDGGTGTNYLEPEASFRVHLKQGRYYSDTAFFALKVTSELSNVNALLFKAPKDSTFTFKAFGNEDNPLEYFVYKNAPVCIYYCFMDSIGGGSLSKHLYKAQTDTLTIVY